MLTTAELSVIAAQHSTDPHVQGAILAALITAQGTSAPTPASPAPVKARKGKLTGKALKAAQDRAAHARASKGASKPAKKGRSAAAIALAQIKAEKVAPVKADNGYDYWASKGAGKRQRAAINAQEKRLGDKLTTKAGFARMTKRDWADRLDSLKAIA